MALSLPFFKFFPNDWLTSEKIGLMTNEMAGAYMHLLAKCWTHETCTLPTDPDTLRHLVQWKNTEEAFLPVLACFPILRNGKRRTNPRLYREWQEACARTEERQQSGAKGAKTRWKAERKPPTPDRKAPTNWLDIIKTNPIYAHVNFEHELGKMYAWQKIPANQRRQINARFVLNWINKIEPPLTHGPPATCSPHCQRCGPSVPFTSKKEEDRHMEFVHFPKFEG